MNTNIFFNNASLLLRYLFLLFVFTNEIGYAQFELQNAFPNLNFSSPLYLTNSGDGTDRIFVVERVGRIKVFPNSAATQTDKTFIDIEDRVTSGGEMGLLGLAFHPNYESNGYFYVNYTYTISDTIKTMISRFQVTSNPDSADKNSEFQILTFTQPFSNHNGGWVGFGPSDGYLYIATGDGGSGGDPQNNAQSINTLLGKILCLDVDGGIPYIIPTTNPFYDSTNTLVKKEIFAWGLRNPWRCSFDQLTGWLIAGDVGQSAWEEIDVIQNGKNYGWRCYEGNYNYNLSGCNYPEYTFPIWEYSHSAGYSITGGYIYRGPNIPELFGNYIYGDYGTRKVWALTYDGINPPTNQLLLTSPGSITSFGVDEQSELYITSFDGNIYKFNPSVGCGNLNLNSGWNLVSVPFLSDDMSATTIFSNSESEVFSYENGYNQVDTVYNGLGYWVKYDVNDIVEVCGSRINLPIEVDEGWNIIGPFDQMMPVQNINTVPPNIIESQFFGFEEGYIATDTLKIGKGYWVKTNASGIVQLNNFLK